MNFQAHNLNHSPSNLLNKPKVLETIAAASTTLQAELDSNVVSQSLLQRERLGITYLGHSIAIPHAKIDGLDEPCFILLRVDQAIVCDELNKKADIFLALLIPAIANEEHLPLLNELVTELKSSTGRQKIRLCRDAAELIEFIEGLPACSTVN